MNCVTFSETGDFFASGGSDAQVRTLFCTIELLRLFEIAIYALWLSWHCLFIYLTYRNNCGRRETTPVSHWIIICVSLLCVGLNNNFYKLFRCLCGRAALTLLSAVMLSDCSMKFPPKCTCLREQPAPQSSPPLAPSHLSSTDRQVQTAFCIPSVFHVNFFYPCKYHLTIPFVNCVKISTTKRKRATLYIYTASLQKTYRQTPTVLSVYSCGDLSTGVPRCSSSFEVDSVAQSYNHISHAGWEILAYFPPRCEKPFDHLRQIKYYSYILSIYIRIYIYIWKNKKMDKLWKLIDM